MTHELETVPTWLRAALGTAIPEVFKLEQRAYDAGIKPKGIGRRGFLQSLSVAAAAVVVDPGEMIWTPGSARERIIIPSSNPFEELQEGVGIFEAFGTRYYCRVAQAQQKHQRAPLNLFFDHQWRLLHALETTGTGYTVVPMFRASDQMRLIKATGCLSVEIAQVACARHNGIAPPDRPYRHRGGHVGILEGPLTIGKERPTGYFNAWTHNPPPQVWDDLSPEETVSWLTKHRGLNNGPRI